jgi:hypothetical protein
MKSGRRPRPAAGAGRRLLLLAGSVRGATRRGLGGAGARPASAVLTPVVVRD